MGDQPVPPDPARPRADLDRSELARVELERQLDRFRRLETLGQLAGGVAHDVNNLLGVILNYAEFVADAVEELAGPTGATVRRDAAQIQRAAGRAISLTRQLLAFGRDEEVRPRVLDLNETVRAVQDLLHRCVGEQVSLATRLRADLWPVRADPGQLEQVLVNLAINARHAMPEGGTLRIETSNVEADPRDADTGNPDTGDADGHLAGNPGRYVRLTVADTGAGMSEEVARRAFEPGFTTKPQGQGTGLGLATVQAIVTQAGGQVWLRSEIDAGTTVTALFPASEVPLPPAAPSLPGPDRDRAGTTAPGVAAPGTTAPGVTAPGTTAPGVAAPALPG